MNDDLGHFPKWSSEVPTWPGAPGLKLAASQAEFRGTF